MPDGWLSVFDADDKATFIREMREALDTADRTGDFGPLEECIRAWRETAAILADPQARAVLTGPLSDEDFTEVGRPRAMKGSGNG
jgi:hypothetical protein